MDINKMIALVLGFAALYLIIRTFLFPEESVSVMGRFPQASMRRKPWYWIFLRIFAPLNSFIIPHKVKTSLNYSLDIINAPMTPEEFVSLQEIITLLGISLIYVIFHKTFPLWGYLLAAMIMFFVPFVHLTNRVKVRKNQIVRFMPETIDILGLCISAGLDFVGAAQWVIAKVRWNAFIEELKKVIDQVTLGKSKTEALRSMSLKLRIPDVSSFTRTLIQAERMGTPVSEAFTILAEDVRMRRFQRGEKTALTAPLKILIPLIFCILPVIGIVIGGPILLEFMQGGLGGVF